VVDRSFHTQSADETFYSYFGNDVTYSIKRTITPDDLSRMEECLGEAERTGDSSTVIRMRGLNGLLRWVLASVRRTGSDEPFFSITFSDVFSLESQGFLRQRRLSDYRCFLGLSGDLAFEYSFGTKHIKIFMFDFCREVTLFDEDLDIWQRSAIEKGYVLSRHADTFNSLCRDIRNGIYRFDYEFESSVLTQGRTKEMYLFRGITRYDSPDSKKTVGIISAISSHQRGKDVNLALESNRDSVSGLLNKRAVTSYAEEIISAKPAYNVELVMVTIDNCAELNSNMGHLFGDEVIYKTAQIIKNEIGTRGIAGRINAGSYMIVLEDIRDEEDLRGVLRAIRTNIETAFADSANSQHITCSMGIAGYPADSSDYRELVMQAEKALMIAQEKGQNRYVIYDIGKHGAVAKDISGRTAVFSNRGEASEKLDFVGSLAENLILGRIPDLSVLLEQIRSGFSLDDICVFAGSDMSLVLSCGNAVSRDASYLFENNYTDRFTGDGVFVIDNVNELEGRDDNAFMKLLEQNIGGAVQYLITEDSIVKGVISFCYIGRFKKWAVSDINYLAIVGRTISALLKKQAYI
jgi:diguanylate cyclase (GGDEF)-like protein